jgi:hypothetical protein
VKPIDQQSFTQALRDWIYADESSQKADRLAAFVIEKAMRGHFAYFKLVIDLVDGKHRQTAEDEMIFETDCVVVVGDEEPCVQMTVAA